MSVSVIVAHQHALVREGLSHILQEMPDAELHATCTNAADLLPMLESGSGVLILDPLHVDGMELQDVELLQQFSGWKVLRITACEQMAMVRQLVGTGIQGYLTRTCDRQEIEEAIMRVAKGETTYCHKVLDILMGQAPADSERCDPAILSEREVEIIRLIASGLTTREIAGKLYRSEHTISTHRKNIMRKLNLRSSSELMVYAMASGLILQEGRA